MKLSRTVTNLIQLAVCPSETLVIYCETAGNNTLWSFLDSNNSVLFGQIAYFASDQPPNKKTNERVTAGMDNNQPLKTHIELPYSPDLNKANILCRSDVDGTHMFTYSIAGK